MWNLLESEYEMFVFQLQQPSDQEVEEFLNQEGFSSQSSSRRSSANSLFMKAMDGRPRRRRSLYSLATRGTGGRQSPDPSNGRRSSLKDAPTSEVEGSPMLSDDSVQRQQSATELLLTPLKQFVAQSQKAFEYLSPNYPSDTASSPNNTLEGTAMGEC